ncbi:imidazolonepropionase-like domain-containing protein [Streptomyces sp. NPDC004065]|uniref:imidazolonepropionase-like domain-containing protein n=1 Tax=Streptomyces sp. NPDC004065 TaxID=3364689 RepID=UPI00384C7C8E
MLTIHCAEELRRTWDDPRPVRDGAVAVEGARIAAVGTLAELEQRFPGARVRRWPGVLGPGRVHEGPLPDAPTPRERVHAVLKLGATAVLAEHAGAPGLRSAAGRNDVEVVPGPRPAAVVEGGRADLAAFDEAGACVATVCAGRLVHRRR